MRFRAKIITNQNQQFRKTFVVFFSLFFQTNYFQLIGAFESYIEIKMYLNLAKRRGQ